MVNFRCCRLGTIGVVVLMCLLSCERVIPYPSLAHEDALLRVDCEVESTDSALVSVSRLYAITYDHRDADENQKDLKSELRFFVNGDEVQSYACSRSSQDRYMIRYPFKQGDRIYLECSAPGLNPVSASTGIPQVSVDVIHEFRVYEEGGKLKADVVLKDNPETYDAYEVSVEICESFVDYVEGEVVRTGSYTVVRNLSIDGTMDGEIRVMDDSYADKDSGIRLLLPAYRMPADGGYIDENGISHTTDAWYEVRLKVSLLSKELYYSRLALRTYDMAPSCYTNIIGGYGCLGGMTTVKSEIIKVE